MNSDGPQREQTDQTPHWALHDPCEVILLALYRNRGMDVIVSTHKPLVDGPWTIDPFVCAHGVPFWAEPTGEQIAAWAAAGIE